MIRVSECIRNLQYTLTEDEKFSSKIVAKIKCLKERLGRISRLDELADKVNESISPSDRQKIIQRIWIENEQFRALQRSNDQLNNALEEQNSEIVVLMATYKRQLENCAKFKDGFNSKVYNDMAQRIQKQQSLIDHMSDTMKTALNLDDEDELINERELISLRSENTALREALSNIRS
ncbi:hypothetical protein GJ496_006131 [Pomphorhynchus laevis]|nr:hypothetical protein GJ496_006131 [Pomphorhynchus laevis]